MMIAGLVCKLDRKVKKYLVLRQGVDIAFES